MKKDAFYFPHFCNARHDRKIKRVTKELGVEGYGIYFMLLEVLREQTDFKFPMGDIDLLSDEFGTSEQKVRTVICNYQLFEVDEDQKFFSTKLVYYLAPYIEKSERARLAANKRWSNTNTLMLSDANAYANALQMECSSNAQAMQVKESKLNKKRVDKTNESRFDEFWLVYPKKVSKGTAQSAFSKIKSEDVDLIIEDVKAKSKTIDWTKEGGKYIPMPSSYLNQRRWEDLISLPKPIERTKEDQFKLAADRVKANVIQYDPFNKGV